jgi:hypothetical protein
VRTVGTTCEAHPGNPRTDWEFVGVQLVPADDTDPAEWLELRNCPNCHTTRSFHVGEEVGRLLCLKPEKDAGASRSPQ